ncbi:MAG: polymer-forming cytoskeletal protein [Proteobacteria bacterium]|nr:polymer-forming cytoskeletal protein [Pseudomonadota bacterium]
MLGRRIHKLEKDDSRETEEKTIDIEAGMEGNIKFSNPVNLKISGKFEGELDTKGVLIIGERADVRVTVIKGENITIAGKVRGDIVSSKRLELSSSAKVIGNIKTPLLIVNQGALLKGDCQMPVEEEKSEIKESFKKEKQSFFP